MSTCPLVPCPSATGFASGEFRTGMAGGSVSKIRRLDCFSDIEKWSLCQISMSICHGCHGEHELSTLCTNVPKAFAIIDNVCLRLTQKSMEFSTFVLIRSSFFLQTDILRPTISVFRLLASDRWHLISALCPPLPDLSPLTSDLWLLVPPFYLLIFSPSAFRIFSTSNSPVFWLLSFDFWLLTSGSSLLTSDLWSPSPDLFLLSPCPLILIKRLT